MFCFLPRIVSVLLLVVAGTLVPAAAEDRAFHAWGEGRVDSWSYSMFGRGQVTHFGRSRMEVGYYPDLLQDGIFIPFNGYIKSGNGDDLYFDFDPELYFFDPAAGVVSTTVTFTGGTGRFQDVTGGADVMFDFTPDFHDFDFLMDGSIDY